jgi:hypothetical protein
MRKVRSENRCCLLLLLGSINIEKIIPSSRTRQDNLLFYQVITLPISTPIAFSSASNEILPKMYFQTPLLLTTLSILSVATAARTTVSTGFVFLPLGTSVPTAITDTSQLSAAMSRISTYQTSLTAQPQFLSVESVANSAIMANDMTGEPTTTVFQAVTTYYGVPTSATWYSALPSDVKGYFQSVASMESKLATGNEASPTEIRKLVGMGLAIAGGLGAALIM